MRHQLRVYAITALISAFMFSQDVAYSASTPATSTRTKNDKADSNKKPWSVLFEVSVESNFLPEEDAAFESSTYFVVSPSYRINRNATVFAILEMDQDMGPLKETSMANTILGLTRDAIAITDKIRFTPKIAAIAPTNEKERNEDTFQGGARIDLSFAASTTMLTKKIDMTYSLRLLKNAHLYERDNLGGANTSYAIRHTAAAKSNLNQIFGVGVIGYYQTAWTYQNAFRSAFLLQEDIYIQLNPTTTFTIYHRNNGNALEANGTSSNLSIYDEVNSFVGASLTMTL